MLNTTARQRHTTGAVRIPGMGIQVDQDQVRAAFRIAPPEVRFVLMQTTAGVASSEADLDLVRAWITTHFSTLADALQ